MRVTLLLFICWLAVACSQQTKKDNSSAKDENLTAPLFKLLPSDSTGIYFSNILNEGLNTNVLMYEYFYNGAGVAIADLNGDDLQDIYFTGNMTDNKLYLNKGNMKFEDVTAIAGVQNRQAPWRTGVTIADINGDHKPDIFVSYSGKVRGENRMSQLFINLGNDNQGVPHFTEKAQDFGLADSGYQTQAYFFDYDKDGDLDMLALNHNPNNLPVLDEASTANMLKQSDKAIGVRLLRNDNNHFVDITDKAGLSSSALTYGLSAAIADIDQDGWQDIYIANDYNVPDYLYINNKNGSFDNKIQSKLGHTSKSSMGDNISDINNDGLPDIYVLDMLPEDNRRQKLLFAGDNIEKFDVILRSGFYYQYMRNMLQINNGNGTFSETAQLSGVSNTDWSWAPLFADYDNDGWKDLFVTNGYTRDYTNMDFLKFMNDYMQMQGRLSRQDVLQILQQMPASNVVNYIFKNNGDLTFENVNKQWGITTSSNSNGAAYADLDNDGDVDLVVNNINLTAFVYRNDANKLNGNNYLNVKLNGSVKNTDGIGAKIYLYNKDTQQYLEQMPARGFQSSVSPVLHFGLGKQSTVDSLKIVWLSGKQQTLKNIKVNQTIKISEADAKEISTQPQKIKSIFTETTSPVKYVNASNDINDFKRQALMVSPLSFSGPCLVKGDVNGDGLEDIYAGGGSGQAAALYMQQKDGSFIEKKQTAFDTDKICEDADAAFFDANGDGSTDIYVASGGYHTYEANAKDLQDRLYLNDGKGNFTKAGNALPQMLMSKSCVRTVDINGDGFTDLFVGGRIIPGRYPEMPQSYILINDGKGNFKDETALISPSLQHIGMVTDAAWLDLNSDNKKDLIVVGEWMPITVFINSNGKLENKTKDYFDKEYSGWWNKISVGDFNGDGKPELIIGNTGLNIQCKASDNKPAEMFYKDFDGNGKVDPVLCFYVGDTSYPFVTRDELIEQLNVMSSRFPDYTSYASATIKDIFTADELKDAKHLQANFLQTAYFENSTDKKFHLKNLPLQAQFSPVFTITQLDYDKDGKTDLLLCGNINHARIRFGKSDANYGVLLHNDGKGNFSYVTQQQSGFNIWGDVRSVISLNNTLLFGINQQVLKAYKLN